MLHAAVLEVATRDETNTSINIYEKYKSKWDHIWAPLYLNFWIFNEIYWGDAVAYLVEALWYKPVRVPDEVDLFQFT
jgi:hypothetical protein